MPSAIAQNNTAFSQNPPQLKQQLQDSLQKYWHYYTSKGRENHSKGHLKEAASYFLEAVRIGRALIVDELTKGKVSEQQGVELLYIASHNLASCYNGQNQSTKGESILKECHDCIIAISMDATKSNELRLESLCVLKKSLFSFASQLAYMNKPADIHSLIDKTEKIANTLQRQLALSDYKNGSSHMDDKLSVL